MPLLSLQLINMMENGRQNGNKVSVAVITTPMSEEALKNKIPVRKKSKYTCWLKVTKNNVNYN